MNQTFTLTVSKIISFNGGGTIFKGKSADGRLVTVVASFNVVSGADVVKEDIWSITGKLLSHPEYGDQLHAVDMELELPCNDLIVDYLLNNHHFRNIGLGQVKLECLWKEFRDSLTDFLDSGDIETLSNRSGISEKVVAVLVERWLKLTSEVKIRKWLKAHGIDKRLAGKIIRIWGERAVEYLEKNPYLLILFLSWKDVDSLGKRLGIASDDARRLVGAVESTTYDRHDHSHTLTPHKTLTNLLKYRISCDTGLAERAIRIAIEEKILVGNVTDGYQHIGVERLERRIHQRLLAMLAGEVGAQIPLITDNDGDLTKDIAAAENNIGFPLSVEQRSAVVYAIKEPLSVVCGGAGTGKTTVLSVIHEILSKHNIPIYQMALSGRAAQRMREATGRPASTIAKFCMEVRIGNRDPSPDALYIIDESSMVDLPSMYRLLTNMPIGSRLLMVGDPHQLPPISFGLVFDRLVESKKVPTVTLKQVHRQTKESGIPAVASAIRSFTIPKGLSEYESSVKTGVSFIECNVQHAARLVWDVFVEMGRDTEQIRTLCAIKAPPAGVTSLNEMFQSRLNQHANFIGESRWRFATGEPVIFLQNNYDLGVFNGSLGIIQKIFKTNDGWKMRILWDDNEVREVKEEFFGHMSLAYAMTVHKAQGSQFRKIICPIFASKNLDNSLIYTALTRGVEQVVFIGDRVAFNSAVVSMSTSMKREVGFRI